MDWMNPFKEYRDEGTSAIELTQLACKKEIHVFN
jgi:hypothetical protein